MNKGNNFITLFLIFLVIILIKINILSVLFELYNKLTGIYRIFNKRHKC